MDPQLQGICGYQGQRGCGFALSGGKGLAGAAACAAHPHVGAVWGLAAHEGGMRSSMWRELSG